MKKGELLSKALVIATNAHAGQYDKGGNAYILHPLKVMYYLKTDDEELQIIALFHDLFEDTDVTVVDLEIAGFPKRVIDAVLCLTKMPGETLVEYKQRIWSNEDAMRVKLCDLRHNSDIRRLKGVTEKDLARMAKYHMMHLEIVAELEKLKK